MKMLHRIRNHNNGRLKKVCPARKSKKCGLRKEKNTLPVAENSISRATSTELFSFLLGCTLIMAVGNYLYSARFFQFDEYLLGLSFNRDINTFGILTLQNFIFSFFIALAVTVYTEKKIACAFSSKKKAFLSNKLRRKLETLCNNKIFAFIIVLIAFSYIIIVFFFKEIANYINYPILMIGFFIIVFSLKYTAMGRMLALFSLVYLTLVLLSAMTMKDKEVDLQVDVFMDNGDKLRAKKCMISKESFLVIKKLDDRYIYVPSSRVIKIEVTKQ